MKRKRFSARPSLEILEDRCVPATISYYNGLLQVTGQTTSLTLTQSAANTFQVKDGATGSTYTFSNVSSLVAIAPNGNDSVTVNLGTFNYTGSLLLKTGNGNDTVSLTAAGGSVLGNVLVEGGLGTQRLNVDGDGTTGAAAGFTGALTIGGTLQVVDTGTSSLAGLENQVYFGNTTGLLTVRGAVSLTGVNTVRINSDLPIAFGSDFSATVAGTNGFLDVRQIDFNAVATVTVAGNVNLTGSNQNDYFDFGGLTINRNLNINFGSSPPGTYQGGNFTGVPFGGVATPGVTHVRGNFTYTGTASTDEVDMGGGLFDGNATLTLGNGADEVGLETAPGFPTVINGNLTINTVGTLDTTFIGAGSGSGAAIAGIQATINGTTSFNLGNGNDTITFANPGTNSGLISIRAGNGVNNINFMGGVLYDINAILGNGTNNVTASNAGTVLIGSLRGGSGTNTLAVTPPATLGTPFYESGF